MGAINAVAGILRRSRFKGYMHLKVIPGTSDAAIRESVSLASAVSINIETARQESFQTLCTTKNYSRDIIRPINLISTLTQERTPYSHVKQTTQFVVGASSEPDRDIIIHSWRLYKQLRLSRIYFSAYQRGLGEPGIPGELSRHSNADLLTREHRLYQVDWLLRKYGFRPEEIPLESDGNLSLTTDPKEMWAKAHPGHFPVNINRAQPCDLLRIPGFGLVTVNRVLAMRKSGSRIRHIEELGKAGKRLKKAQQYVDFG
ncbi:MAG: hypothetical protein ABH872_04775 [Candidatus Omnitrophota bacterium]